MRTDHPSDNTPERPQQDSPVENGSASAAPVGSTTAPQPHQQPLQHPPEQPPPQPPQRRRRRPWPTRRLLAPWRQPWPWLSLLLLLLCSRTEPPRLWFWFALLLISLLVGLLQGLHRKP